MQLAFERRGEGEPLVLIHGIGSQWQIWIPVLDALARERDVIALDLPGFGGSPVLDARPTTEALADAVAAFLDEHGVADPHVAGNSLGGGIALELGRAGRASSVTALSPIGFWNHREWVYARASLRATARFTRTAQPVLPFLLRSAVGRALLLAQVMSRPWRLSADGAAQGVQNLATSPGFDPTLDAIDGWRFERGAELHCPVTIAWAKRDWLLIPRQANRARRALPDARHVTLEGCGHVPMADDPDQVARVILAGSRVPAPAAA
jgi:pimeloyl-ACP methyl ester carboxylesterase